MNIRATLFLFILVLLLGFLLQREYPGKHKHQLRENEPERFFSLAIENINAFGVRTRLGEFECERAEDNWFVGVPIKARANSAVVNRMISTVEQLPVFERLLPEDLRRRSLAISDYGLDSPVAVITFGTPLGKRLLDVGACSPLGDSVYVRWQNSSEIIAVATGILFLARADLRAVREPRLVLADESSVIRLELKVAGQPLIQLSREGHVWSMQKPRSARADARRVHDLLARILRLEARAFVSETMADPIAYGFGDDEAELQIGLGFIRGRQSERLAFGRILTDRPELVYACMRDGNSVVAVDHEEIGLLCIKPENVRDHRLPLPPFEKVRVVRLQHGERTMLLARASGVQWWILEPARWSADKERVEDLFRYLSGIRVQAFLPASGSQAPAIDMTRPAGQLSLSTARIMASADFDREKLSPDFTLRWQDFAGTNRLMAVCGDDDEYLELPPNIRQMLDIEPSWFRDLNMLTLDPGQVRRITLSAAGALQTIDRGERGEWCAAPLSPGMADADFVKDILAWASSLRALGLEQTFDGASSEWRAPRFSLTFGLASAGGFQKTILFGADAPDGRARAVLQGQDTVFILDPTMPRRLLQHGLVQ